MDELVVKLCLDLDGRELVVTMCGGSTKFVVELHPQIVLAVATDLAAAASEPLTSLLALLITPHLGTGKFLNDVFDRDLLDLSAL